jgi:hypothetical protein
MWTRQALNNAIRAKRSGGTGKLGQFFQRLFNRPGGIREFNPNQNGTLRCSGKQTLQRTLFTCHGGIIFRHMISHSLLLCKHMFYGILPVN